MCVCVCVNTKKKTPTTIKISSAAKGNPHAECLLFVWGFSCFADSFQADSFKHQQVSAYEIVFHFTPS